MNLSSILAITVKILPLQPLDNPVQLDWIGRIIQTLIEGCHSIGLGIILFTLILKLITLPFDIYSRVSTKKNAVMMEKIRPELERLQRQYSNNKELYQRKLQDLYKKNRYNPLSSCLPMLLNLIFFFIVIGQFSTYSNFANLGIFCEMSDEYNQAISELVSEDDSGIILNPEYGEYDDKKVLSSGNLNIYKFLNEDSNQSDDFKTFGFTVNYDEVAFGDETTDKIQKVYDLMSSGNLSGYSVEDYFELNEDGTPKKDGDNFIFKTNEVGNLFEINKDNIATAIYHYLRRNNKTDEISGYDFEINHSDIVATADFGDETTDKIQKVYNLMSSGVLSGYKVEYYFELNEDGTPKTDGDGNFIFKADEFGKDKDDIATSVLDYYANDFVEKFIKEKGRVAAADVYRAKEKDIRFLWVKNVWSQDLPWEHPIKRSFNDYHFIKKSSCTASCNPDNAVPDYNQYNELTAGLEEEKKVPNGYLILVLLSIGTMLLSQIIMQKQNKTQMELSDVNGENGTAAMSQKMMMWMMPIMFGIFSFMYTASFSIYIIVSSVLSLVATLIINWSVEKHYEHLAKIEADREELKRTGRITQIEPKKGKKHDNKDNKYENRTGKNLFESEKEEPKKDKKKK